jgi:hypothetical protein
MHPGPKTGVAVEWTSPVSGSVQVRGRVSDGDPNCGDGIDWRIEHGRAGSVEIVADGSFPNGGQQDLSQGQGGAKLEAIAVRKGDSLQFTVFPKGNYFCDTTIVEFEITERDGERRHWSLSQDVVPDLLQGEKGNPHVDSAGNPGVWQFCEAGEEGRGEVLAAGSSLAKWIEAAREAQDKRSKELLAAVSSALIELDGQASELRKSGKDLSGLGGPNAKLYHDLTDSRGPFWSVARKDGTSLPPEAKTELAKKSKDLADLKKSAPAIDEANALVDGGVPQSEYAGIHDSYVLIRGRYDRKGPLVSRSFPRLLAGDNQPPITSGSGRLELARWIASPSNPMTARVLVNRLWQHHFGEGIVRTPNNFGKLGVPPTHPELLDYLALRLIEDKGSIKSIHRLIMLSAAYQQASVPEEQTFKADPDNLMFGHMNRQRLEAEPFRDALLAVTGNLDETMGGPAFRDPATPRRTIYLMTVRSDRSNYRTLFDAADPTSIVDKRIDSTVAPQALFLMNNPFVLDRAKSLADRLLKEEPSDDRARIDRLYQLLYSRPPGEKEMEIGLSAVSSPPVSESWERYCQVLLCANEFVYVD